jgi:N-methylhydantoinase B/oxoprolinase/acetone carboxylase alpha subunit
MTEEEWVLVDKIQGLLQAEIIKGLLEAQGIQVWLNAQGAARAYAVTVGTLGAVELLVPSSQADQAREVLEEYNRGDFENIKLDESEPGEGSEE